MTLVCNILRLIEAGNYPAKIARLLGKSKQHIHYYCKKLEKLGYLRRTVRDSAVFYEVTQAGKNFLMGSERFFTGRWFRLHSFALKFPVLKEPDRPVVWGKVVRLRNWSKFIGSVCGLRVERTTGHLIVYADVLEGDDPWQLMFLAWRECCRLAGYLQSKFGMRLGVPKLKDPRPHFAVYDPIAEKFSEYIKVSNDVADIDRSPPYRSGEIDWHDPNLAKDYLLMPARVAALESQFAEFKREVKSEFADLKAGLMTIFKTWNLVGNRLLDLFSRFEATASRINAVSPLASDVCFNGAGRATAMFATTAWGGA